MQHDHCYVHEGDLLVDRLQQTVKMLKRQLLLDLPTDVSMSRVQTLDGAKGVLMYHFCPRKEGLLFTLHTVYHSLYKEVVFS